MLRLVLVLLLLSSGTAFAQSTTAALSQCLAESTDGKERKDLARWVFLAMASHPEMKQFMSPVAAVAEAETHKVMAGLFTKLLADSCLRQTQAAFKEGGVKAIEVPFQTLGQLAMQELMTTPEFSASMGMFEKQLDPSKLAKAFGN
jgi:hypothetical protein